MVESKFSKNPGEKYCRKIIKIDPENSKSYNENALQYVEKLELLDLQIREELSSCSKKDFITYHNAFSYFSDEYGLTQHTITKGVHRSFTTLLPNQLRILLIWQKNWILG